jgi:hypothetical protein
MFAALEDLDTVVNVNSAWETIRENIKISAKESLGYYEMKKHAQNYYIIGNKLNCSDCRVQMK